MELFDQPIRDPEIRGRAEMTFELSGTAEQMMRENIRRRHPELDRAEVEKRFVGWLRRRTRDDSYGRHSEKWAAKFGSQQ
jgi:Rv0078B-related antitoxin